MIKNKFSEYEGLTLNFCFKVFTRYLKRLNHNNSIELTGECSSGFQSRQPVAHTRRYNSKMHNPI